MATVMESTPLQFPVRKNGELKFTARVGWARVLAAQTVQEDYTRLESLWKELSSPKIRVMARAHSILCS